MTEYKITLSKHEALDHWVLDVFERENRDREEPTAWRCILHTSTYRLEGHVDARMRMRQVMRSLA